MNKTRLLKFPAAWLLIILPVSFALRISNLNYNTPFLDEAQYIVLGRKVLAGHWQESDPFSWVGGMPLVYPPLSALFGAFGIFGARFLNVLFGTMSVYLLYLFAARLHLSKNQKTNGIIGLVSASFLGIMTIPLYLSRLAIYDMPSFTFFLLGLIILQRALLIKKPLLWQQENGFFASSFFFLLSFLTKYTTFIFFPFILLWAYNASRKSGKVVLTRYLKYFAAILITGTLLYFSWRFDALSHFLKEQVGASKNQSLPIITQFTKFSLPMLFPAVLTILLFLSKRKFPHPFTMLLIGAMVVPLIHLATNNIKAVNQQVFLSLIFLLPLSAYFFTYIWERFRLIGGFILPLFLITVFVISQNQLRQLETSWSNTQKIMDFLKSVTTGHEKILSFEDDVTKLSLTNLPENNITGIYSFTYQGLSDENAYSQAVKDGYFNFILYNQDLNEPVKEIVKTALSNHYRQIYQENHHFTLFRLEEKTV